MDQDSTTPAGALRILGEQPLAKDAHGELRSRIATIFPNANILITLPGVHATQRLTYIDLLNRQRREASQPPLATDEEDDELEQAVDLILDEDAILIRPDPENMPLAFAGDELLQTLAPKRHIKFLFVRDARVRDAIKRRGECWRINPLPRSVDEMKQMVQRSRIGIGGRPIYYYNRARGTRLLTCQEFSQLEPLRDAELRDYLREIREFSASGNRLGGAEIGFFMAEDRFGAEDFAPYDFAALEPAHLRDVFQNLACRFHDAVPPEFRHDDLEDLDWRKAMFAALIAQRDEVVPEETLLGLSPEFFMQIEWLPGGRIEGGELILDPVFEEMRQTPDPELAHLCDQKAHGFIFNFIREYGDLEYVNMGRVTRSLSRRNASSGRRDVYIAQIKQRESTREIVHIIRMQKWGVREHLDEGKSLLDAIIESEEYTEYIMDRRLGCRQLGMHLPAWIAAKRISEPYTGPHRELSGVTIWSPYFERDYIHGIATDKMPASRLENEECAVRLAWLLGRAAAPNIVLGRCDLEGHVVFDDGDEVVIEDYRHMPLDIIVSDHTGTFTDYRTDLQQFAAAYAQPVNRRREMVPDPLIFGRAYIEAFLDRFVTIQQDYRKRQRAFDTLFKHRPRNESGSFAFRWEQVLQRLNRTDPQALADLIRAQLVVH